MRVRSLLTVGLAVCIAATSAAACKSSGGGGGGGTTGAAPAPSNSGGGASGKTLVIGTDLPLQGSNKDTSDSTNNLIQLYLDSVGDKAGNFKIKLKNYDDSTAAAGSWDAATCTQNANAHVANTDEVAVMGTYNSGCAKLEVPILNQANPPMLMVSDANTSPGITKQYVGNDPGEPDKYYPTGKRNYARVVSTDDFQGPADANFAADELHVKRCFVVNDNSTYGKGVAGAFVKGAQAKGITILGNQAYDSKQTSYASLFTKVKSQNPDCVFIGGTYDLNGGELIKDKFNVLGNNDKVKLLAPDGYTGFPDLDKQPESQGMYLSFAGLDTGQILAKGGPPATLLNAYKAKYGSMPIGSYPIYGVAAIQVILAAIAKSDGTRQSIIDQVFSGSGITIPESVSAIGKEFSISTSTGDVSAKDYSILQEKNHTAVFLKNVSA